MDGSRDKDGLPRLKMMSLWWTASAVKRLFNNFSLSLPNQIVLLYQRKANLLLVKKSLPLPKKIRRGSASNFAVTNTLAKIPKMTALTTEG